MITEQIKKLLVNVAQSLSEAEKLQGRTNIDAAKNALATQSNDGLMSSSDKTKLDNIQAGAEVNVQSDWAQTNTNEDDYIKNKPANLVQDASYVHTDNNFTTAEKTKLDGVEAGAEVNVQSDWTQTDTSSDDYIKNKPSNLVQDASYVHTDNNFTTAEKTKLAGIAAGAEVNVQSDWAQADSGADDYIKNKPSNLVQDASYVHTDNNFTTAEKNKLGGIEAGAEVNVQSDWTATSGDAQILNKPEIGYKSYGDTNVTEATSLVVDGDEPNGTTDVKVNGSSKGSLISGPYATLLDSGINGSVGDADRGMYIDSNGVFQACTGATVFEVTLNTTLAQLDAAVAAGKIPLLVTSNRVIPMCRYASGSNAQFTSTAMRGSSLSVSVQTYVLSSSGWAVNPTSVNTNDALHLPNCITAKVAVRAQETVDTWLTIGAITIGGYGTQGSTIAIMIKGASNGTSSFSYNFVYDTLFRTSSTSSSAGDNSVTYGSVQTSSTWTNLFTIDQYSGTSTVDCKLTINLYDTINANPAHYVLEFRKLYDGSNTMLYISAVRNWGSIS